MIARVSKCSVHKILAIGMLLPGICPAVDLESLEQVAELELRYQQSELRYAEESAAVFPRYLGSGNGDIQGKLGGQILWDMYQRPGNDELRRVNFVGWVTSEQDVRVQFEAFGMYKPRDDGLWELTASVNLSCETGNCQWVNAIQFVWLGSVRPGEWIHRGCLYSVR